MTRSETIGEISFHYWSIFGFLQLSTVQEWIDLDLSGAQVKLLFVLGAEGPTTIGKLAEKLSVSAPTASQLVEKLVQLGHVTRTADPHDRRQVHAEVTPQGRERMQRLRSGNLDDLSRYLDRLNDDELEALLVGLRALARVSYSNAEASPPNMRPALDREPPSTAEPGS